MIILRSHSAVHCAVGFEKYQRKSALGKCIPFCHLISMLKLTWYLENESIGTSLHLSKNFRLNYISLNSSISCFELLNLWELFYWLLSYWLSLRPEFNLSLVRPNLSAVRSWLLNEKFVENRKSKLWLNKIDKFIEKVIWNCPSNLYLAIRR